MQKEIENAAIGILVAKGLVSSERIEECLAIQREMQRMGLKPKPLLEILVEKKFLAKEQAGLVARGEADSEGPKEIPGYEILGTIGKGAMGTVYKGYQKSMEREVAIKVLASELALDKSYVERFLTEARMAAKVQHTNIVTGIDVGQVGGMYYLVMEYFPGRPLNTLIYEKGRLPVEKAVDIAVQIADALKHAHANNLVHRDIKPENILVLEDGTAKLCDMGLAKLVEREARGDSKGETVGTPLYISPEIVQGRPDIDIRSDIYSLGATLYHMLLGRPPFLGVDPVSIMRMHVDSDVVHPSKRDESIPEDLSAVVTRMMSRNIAQRYQSPAELLAALEAIRHRFRKKAPSAAPRPSAPVLEPIAAATAQKPLSSATPAKPLNAAVPQKPLSSATPAKPPRTDPALKLPKPPVEPPKRKAKTRRAKSSSMAFYIILLAAVAAGAVIVIAMLPGGSKAPEPKPDRSDDRNQPSPADEEQAGPGVPDDATPGREESQKAMLDEAARFEKDHPDALEAALERYEKIASLTPATKASAEAQARAGKLRDALCAIERKEFETVCGKADSILAGGRNLDGAVDAWSKFLERFRVSRAGLAEEAASRKKAAMAAIARLWAAVAGNSLEHAAKGDFDSAQAAVQAAIADGGIASAQCIAKAAGEDPLAFLEDLRKRREEYVLNAEKNAGPMFAAFAENLARLYSEGRTPGGMQLGPFSRYREALRTCKAAEANPALMPRRQQVAEWLDISASAAAFASSAALGLEGWASKKRHVVLRNPEEEVSIVSISASGIEKTVKLSNSVSMRAEDFLERLDHEAVYQLAFEGLGGSRMNAEMNRGAALFIVLSPVGSVSNAAERVDSHLGRAGASIDSPAALVDLLARHRGSAAVADALREFEALRKSSEKARDKAQAQKAIEKWKAWAEKYAGSKTATENEAFLASELKRLDAVANPPQPVKVPGLAVKAEAFDAKTGKARILYEFDERGFQSDWASRRFHFGADNWAGYAIENFMGKSLEVKTTGGCMSASGGGFLLWKPRVVGDFAIEADLSFQAEGSGLFLAHMTDNGGYAFANNLDISELCGWASANRVPMTPASGTGLFTARLAWPPTFKSLSSDTSFKLAPARWYSLSMTRKGKAVSIEICQKGKKPEKTWTFSDDQFKEGRIGLCLMKSGVSIDNFSFNGALDLRWLSSAEQGGEDSGDMPGAGQ